MSDILHLSEDERKNILKQYYPGNSILLDRNQGYYKHNEYYYHIKDYLSNIILDFIIFPKENRLLVTSVTNPNALNKIKKFAESIGLELEIDEYVEPPLKGGRKSRKSHRKSHRKSRRKNV